MRILIPGIVAIALALGYVGFEVGAPSSQATITVAQYVPCNPKVQKCR